MGMKEQNIIAQAVRFGDKIPDKILNAPKLESHLQIYLTAFFELDSDRSVGMSLGRIPWSSVCKYSEFYEFDKDQAEDLFYFVAKMDDVYLKFVQRDS